LLLLLLLLLPLPLLLPLLLLLPSLLAVAVAVAVAVAIAIASEVERGFSPASKDRRVAASILPKAGAKAKPKRLIYCCCRCLFYAVILSAAKNPCICLSRGSEATRAPTAYRESA